MREVYGRTPPDKSPVFSDTYRALLISIIISRRILPGDASFCWGCMSFAEADVLAVASDWLAKGHGVALATVIKTTGSAPRQGGSHIVVRDDGAFAGSVSAGCVENAVIELAQAALADGQNRTASFGISEGVFAPGLLCGGEIEILVEPIL